MLRAVERQVDRLGWENRVRHAIDSASSSEAGGILQTAMILREDLIPITAISIFCDGENFIKEYSKYVETEEIHGKLHCSFKQFSVIRECLMRGASRRELENMSLKHSKQIKRFHSNGVIKIERRRIKPANGLPRLAAQYTYRVTIRGEEVFFPVGVDARNGIKRAEKIYRDIKNKASLLLLLQKYHPSSRRIKELERKEGEVLLSITNATQSKPIPNPKQPSAITCTSGLKPTGTIGQITELLKNNAIALGLAESTVKGYILQLNKMLICGLSKYQKAKHFSPPPKALMKEPVTVLTSEVVIEFRRFLLDKIEDKAERRKKGESLNSTLRQAKAVFSRDAMNLYSEADFLVPYPESFMNVSNLRATKKAYRLPEYDTMHRIFNNLQKLHHQHPDIYVCLLLALFVGLRHEEISNLPRSAIRKTDRWRVHVSDQPDFTVKDYEERDIPVPHELAEHILGISSDPESAYLIGGHMTYRTQKLPDEVNEYLRKHGLRHIQKPTHEMRKWFGSAMNYIYSLNVARLRLGHADEKTTKQSYVDDRMTSEQAVLWERYAKKLFNGPAFTKRD